MVELAKMPGRPALSSLSVAGRRPLNEDSTLLLEKKVGGGAVVLMVVADGMGGHAQGEVASKLACDVLKGRWPDLLSDLRAVLPEDVHAAEARCRRFLLDAFLQADFQIAERAEKDLIDESMGTTLVVALSVHGNLLFANVGDSRAYIIRRDDIARITSDHSVVEDAVRRGVMSEEEAGASSFRHALTRSIDGSGDAVPDFFPDRGWISGYPAAIAFLCSDGLYGPLTDLDLFEYFVRTPDIDTATRALTWKAVNELSQDNISLVAIETGQLSRSPDLLDLPTAELDRIASWTPPIEEDETSVARRRLIGRLVLGIVGMCFVLAVLWKMQMDASVPDLAATRPLALRAHADRLVNPMFLSWSTTGNPAAKPQFTVAIAGPRDSLSNHRELVHVGVEASRLSFTEIEREWPEEMRAGEYRWSVIMVVDSDTVRSEVQVFRLSPASVPDVLGDSSRATSTDSSSSATQRGSDVRRPAARDTSRNAPPTGDREARGRVIEGNLPTVNDSLKQARADSNSAATK